MEFRIWVETLLAGQTLERHNVATVERAEYPFASEEIGLSLEEGKSPLQQAQLRTVETQADVLGATERACVPCKRNQRVKDIRRRCVRTVFGSIQVAWGRSVRCHCRGGNRKSSRSLGRRQFLGTTPELQYLYATWGSKLPYRKAAALLKDQKICSPSQLRE